MRQARSHYPYPTPYGPVTVAVEDECVVGVALGAADLGGEQRPSELANRAATELQEYLAGKRPAFDLPLHLEGTPFQQAVWKAVQGIPYATSRTASQVAEDIGHAGSQRAVGAALRKNPCAVLVPGHRVVGADGTPWGTGREARVRGALLQLEREALERRTLP